MYLDIYFTCKQKPKAAMPVSLYLKSSYFYDWHLAGKVTEDNGYLHFHESAWAIFDFPLFYLSFVNDCCETTAKPNLMLKPKFKLKRTVLEMENYCNDLFVIVHY
ncbi:unnamed protein product [Bursaphelenchus okinawaensis]|uniref:Uncharacterized protein n=1 Tax=Bursaphelenchus okinawaensis TaxID=465554 RepID=A0A811LQC1_9BILA|nr:unnamed protein product [Bursaphelenchus okinawaensis]CAG9127857.1 unnamed protein product [Bursaphelenchus okinawaensis]